MYHGSSRRPPRRPATRQSYLERFVLMSRSQQEEEVRKLNAALTRIPPYTVESLIEEFKQFRTSGR